MKRFSQLCDCINDQCSPANSGATVYVGLEHVDGGAFFLKRHGSPVEVRSAKSRFKKGDILYGKLRPYLNKAVIAGTDGICSTDILVFRAKPDVCASYLLGLIHSQDFMEHAAQTTNGVNHPRTSWPGLSPFNWNVPEKTEQEKIAAVLWKIQRAIEVERKLTARARELKQATMRQLFTCGLRGQAQHETEAGLVPESWEVSGIRANYRLVAGGTPERDNPAYWHEGTIPWVKTGEVDYCVITDTEEKITQSGLDNSAAKLLPSGTVLVAMYGQGITRGKVAMLGIEAATNQACVGLIPKNDNVLPKYLHYFLTYSYERLRSLSHGAQQQNLNAELVGSFQVAFPKRDERPEKDEQLDIVQMLSTIDQKIALHKQKHRTLRELFQTLLHKLMTGEIRVADLDIDVSEVTQ